MVSNETKPYNRAPTPADYSWSGKPEKSAELLSTSIIAAALIEKSGLSYFFTTSGVINQPNIEKLKTLIKAFDK